MISPEMSTSVALPLERLRRHAGFDMPVRRIVLEIDAIGV